MRLEQSISLAAEWLLDNAYIVRRHVGDVRRNLSRRFYDVLPILGGAERAGQPRIYDLSYELVSHTDAEVHVQDVTGFLEAYQRDVPLTTGELWAMPLDAPPGPDREPEPPGRAPWTGASTSTSGPICGPTACSSPPGARPTSCCSSWPSWPASSPTPRPTSPTAWSASCRASPSPSTPSGAGWSASWGRPVPEVIQHEQLRHAADQVTIANAIGSLRRLSNVDWRDIFESTSTVHGSSPRTRPGSTRRWTSAPATATATWWRRSPARPDATKSRSHPGPGAGPRSPGGEQGVQGDAVPPALRSNEEIEPPPLGEGAGGGGLEARGSVGPSRRTSATTSPKGARRSKRGPAARPR